MEFNVSEMIDLVNPLTKSLTRKSVFESSREMGFSPLDRQPVMVT